MICPNCKKEVPDGTKFCIYCGAAIGDGAQVQSTPAGTQFAGLENQSERQAQSVQAPQAQYASQGQAAPASQQTTDNGKRTKKLNTILIICVVVLLIVVAVVVTVLVMSHSKQKEALAPTDVPSTQAQQYIPAAPQTDNSNNSVVIQQPNNPVDPYNAMTQFTEKGGRSYVTLRSAPSQDSKEVTKIPVGEIVSVESEPEEDRANNIHYCYISYEGYHGWVRSGFLTTNY